MRWQSQALGGNVSLSNCKKMRLTLTADNETDCTILRALQAAHGLLPYDEGKYPAYLAAFTGLEKEDLEEHAEAIAALRGGG